MLRLLRAFSTRTSSPPRVFPAVSFQLIDPSTKVGEETLTWYTPGRFYNVRLGQVFNFRYQVLSKLGFGSCSTAWLCRDLNAHTYVALKVCISNYPSIERERAAYAHLREAVGKHREYPGSRLVRTSTSEFEVVGPEGHHRCFVFEPLTIDLNIAKCVLKDAFDESVFKRVTLNVLQALDFLHSRAKMVHGDLRFQNFFLSAHNDVTFRELEASDMGKDPSPRKIDGDRIIYEGHGQMVPADHRLLGVPILCDFGEARFGHDFYTDGIQPFMYQAPEVVFDIPWSYPADIWNAGLMLWHLFQGQRLIPAEDAEGNPDFHHLVAGMVGVMGLPPAAFLARASSDTRECWFDDAGEWYLPDIVISRTPLEEVESTLRAAGKDNQEFVRFMRRILTWEPEKRATAAELLEDPWLANVTSSTTLLGVD